jgi:transcriptional regulator with XRE-family HTH domain
MSVNSFLQELMRRRKRLPSQLAGDLGVSHVTVRRWLFGEDIPNLRSCKMLAEYSGIPLQKVLKIVGQIPELAVQEAEDWPEFREYALKKYANILDEDIITMVEDLIERRRNTKFNRSKKRKA